ncbi:unnamed protein product [Spirodela intermedia]|uniref:Major facilitator superfamily (MFS) profile domain-containing protein n=1 Tax=Spirodela intermedia TaxID=51605 RepID=A0A7I8KTA0_SPIIN|nr:unnamed protein product [Spirodela intermedia]
MAGGGFAAASLTADYGGGTMTASTVVTCLIAASGGLIFGYDMGISGGLTTMKSFLRKFFPYILSATASTASSDEYCVYNSQILTAFTSSLYLAALFSSLIAGRLTAIAGRRVVMVTAGALYLTGAAINASAANVVMLIAGRFLLGFGVGFANQATPVYIVEMAPARWRGALVAAFQLSVGLGVLTANLVNYAANRVTGEWGWRLALGLAAAPAVIFLVGAVVISDTPSSLVARGRLDSAREALLQARGAHADVDAELEDILYHLEARQRKHGEEGGGGAFRRVLSRRYRHYLITGVLISFFQQMTGINVVAFYAPVMFQTVGFADGSSLMAAVVLAAINLVSILVSTVIVDRYGRRVLFIQGGGQMFICLVAVGCVMAATAGGDSGALAVLLLTCIYSAGYGWSWGPLSWLVPCEIFPEEVRSAGQAIVIALNLGVCFVQAQVFLAALCWMKYGLFLFFAGWIAVMTAFVAAFLPETKGVPLEAMEGVWAAHWFWKRFALPRD